VKLEMMPMGEAASWTCHGRVTIASHCLGLTHLDALGHVYLHGRTYNGRWATDHVTDAGLAFADVKALCEGVFTRGPARHLRRSRCAMATAGGEDLLR
jgi:hypothetical protein